MQFNFAYSTTGRLRAKRHQHHTKLPTDATCKNTHTKYAQETHDPMSVLLWSAIQNTIKRLSPCTRPSTCNKHKIQLTAHARRKSTDSATFWNKKQRTVHATQSDKNKIPSSIELALKRKKSSNNINTHKLAPIEDRKWHQVRAHASSRRIAWCTTIGSKTPISGRLLQLEWPPWGWSLFSPFLG